MIKGIPVLLHVKTQTGEDDFGNPTYAETTTQVENVIVSPATDDQVVTDISLHGKHLAYVLCIPKGDTHDWTDTLVEFFGRTFRTYGAGMEYIEELVPLEWNKKVKVEIYE